MKRIVFLGYCIPLDQMKNNAGLSIAGNKMQWNILHYLSEYKDIDLKVVTIYPMVPFPRSKKMFYKQTTLSLDNNITALGIGFINLPIIKQFSQIGSVFRNAKKFCSKNDDIVIITFNVFPQVGIPMRWLKHIFSQAKTLSILADLPIDDNEQRKGFSKLLRKIFDHSTLKSISKCDSFVVLNKYVAESYLPNKPYIVVEGGVNEETIEPYEYLKAPEKNIFFCGALTEYNGVRNLIEAMKYVDEDIVLDIYGSGLLADFVAKASAHCPRIRFHGPKTNAEIISLQRKAWLLVNPRVIDNHISKVTFPSKTFEYLLSCRPVLSTRLNCLEGDYESLMFLTGDEPEQLADSINHINTLEDSAFMNITKRAYDFVVKERTWRSQAKTIHDLINRV